MIQASPTQDQPGRKGDHEKQHDRDAKHAKERKHGLFLLQNPATRRATRFGTAAFHESGNANAAGPARLPFPDRDRDGTPAGTDGTRPDRYQNTLAANSLAARAAPQRNATQRV